MKTDEHSFLCGEHGDLACTCGATYRNRIAALEAELAEANRLIGIMRPLEPSKYCLEVEASTARIKLLLMTEERDALLRKLATPVRKINWFKHWWIRFAVKFLKSYDCPYCGISCCAFICNQCRSMCCSCPESCNCKYSSQGGYK